MTRPNTLCEIREYEVAKRFTRCRIGLTARPGTGTRYLRRNVSDESVERWRSLTRSVDVCPDVETGEVLIEAVELTGRARRPSEVLEAEGGSEDDRLSDVDDLGSEARVPAQMQVSHDQCRGPRDAAYMPKPKTR